MSRTGDRPLQGWAQCSGAKNSWKRLATTVSLFPKAFHCSLSESWLSARLLSWTSSSSAFTISGLMAAKRVPWNCRKWIDLFKKHMVSVKHITVFRLVVFSIEMRTESSSPVVLRESLRLNLGIMQSTCSTVESCFSQLVFQLSSKKSNKSRYELQYLNALWHSWFRKYKEIHWTNFHSLKHAESILKTKRV